MNNFIIIIQKGSLRDIEAFKNSDSVTDLRKKEVSGDSEIFSDLTELLPVFGKEYVNS